MAKEKNKSTEEKLLEMLRGQLLSAYATGLFGVKDYEKKLSQLSPGQVIGVKGQILGSRQAKLTRVCAFITAAQEELEELQLWYD